MPDHTHDDPDRLTVACPACAERVKADQVAARLAETPEYQLRVCWRASGRSHEYRTTRRLFPEWLPLTPGELADRLDGVFDQEVAAEIAKHFPSGTLGEEAARSARVIGVHIVSEIVPEPEEAVSHDVPMF